MKSRVVVTILIEHNGKYLLGKKSNGVGPYPNTWHFPGGGVQLGEESLIDAVKREISEETGLEVSDLTRVAFDEDYEQDKHGKLTHYLFLLFKATALHGKHQVGDDLVHLQWFTKDELQKLVITRPGMKFITEFDSLLF
jgi:8-oxo-dGTP diphosphatase